MNLIDDTAQLTTGNQSLLILLSSPNSAVGEGRPGEIYPSAVFGTGPAGYGVRERDATFPEVAVEALERLARQFRWSNLPRGRVGDCFAVWPGDGGLLAARLRDSGTDDHDRPHALRIDARWLPAAATPDDILAALGCDEARLRDAVARHPGRRLLVAPHRDFEASGFDAVLAVGREDRSPERPVRNAPTPTVREPSRRPLVIAFVIGVLVGGLAVALASRDDSAERLRAAQIDNERLQRENEQIQHQVNDLRDRGAKTRHVWER